MYLGKTNFVISFGRNEIEKERANINVSFQILIKFYSTPIVSVHQF